MGSLYSKMSGRSGRVVAAAAAADAQDVDPKHDPDGSTAPPHVSLTGSEDAISLGIEVKVNGESDDSHLVTSSSSAASRSHVVDEDGDEDTDDTEPDDVHNASLAVHPSTDETLNNDASHVSESNGHNSSGSPTKAETVATWAQVVAGMNVSAPPAASHASAELNNDTDEQESVTSDDSSSVNSNEVNGRHRSAGASANGSTGSRTRQRSSGGKRSSSIRTSTPTSSPNKRLRGGGDSSATSSPVSAAAKSGTDSERPFACRAPGCEWAFKALFHLNRHRKTVHGFNEPVTAASYQLMQQQWAAQQQQPAGAAAGHQEVLEVDGQVHHHQQQHQQQDMSNFFDHVLLDANSPNTY